MGSHKPPVIARYYELAFKQGIINSKLAHDRYFMFSCLGWGAMIRELEKVFGSGGPVILKAAGRGYGLAVGKATSDASGPQSDVTGWLRDGTEYLAASGWGIMKVTELPGGVGAFDIELKNCWGCWGRKDDKRPSCFFATGLFEGLISGVSGREFTVTETACKLVGSPVCKFRVRLV